MKNTLLEEISAWKLEAKLDDLERYFYHIDLIRPVENGARCYIIGRKGTGKTAICEYLDKIREPNKFSCKLTFKNFPFNDLYSLTNMSYRPPNQYITLWKYLIYSSIAKLLVDNENIAPTLRGKLEKIYNREDMGTSLSRTITKWTSSKLNLSILGTGFGYEGGRETKKSELTWIEKVEILESILLQNLDDSKYMIIFDELDEDYKDVIKAERHEQYTALLTSLFKAVQDIKSIFSKEKFQVFPMIFLRDDIYDIIQDPDKTKWNDLKIELDWDERSIKNLLAFRLTKAFNPGLSTMPFTRAWKLAFADKPVRYGHKQQKQTNAFNFITRSTQRRPRDYIRYLQACAEETMKHKYSLISPQTIIKVDKAFSNYLRSELEDEIHGILPEIRHILDLLSKIRKQTLFIREFESAYKESVEKGEMEGRNIEFILRILFHFSVIGNQPKQKNIQVFRYENPEARFNLNEKIIIHRGLFKALQIL